MKKFLCAILALALVILPVGGGVAVYADDMVLPAAAYASASVKAAGTCGTVSWTLYNDGELNLAPTSGNEGTLDDITAYYDAPWNSYRASIVSVDMTGTIHAGSAVSYMFYWCESLAELDLTYANYEIGYFTVSSAGMPIILEDAEIILRNTDTYYLHAEISSKF